MTQALLIFWICLLRLLSATKHGAFATAVSYTAPLYPINASLLVSSQNLESPFPYQFPDLRHADDLFPMPECNGVTLEEATVDRLQVAMNKGQLTSVKIALCYLQRIYQTDDYAK